MKALAKAALIGALVLTAIPAHADDDARKAAQELVDLINTRTLDQMLTSISGAMWPTIEAGMPASIDTELPGLYNALGALVTVIKKKMPSNHKLA